MDISYNNLWTRLHESFSNEKLTHQDMLTAFGEVIKILQKKQDKPCMCDVSAVPIFEGLLGYDKNNFLELKIPNGTKKFMEHFHNMINLKLNKPIFTF